VISALSRLISLFTFNLHAFTRWRLGMAAVFVVLILGLWQNSRLPKELFPAMTPRRAFGAAVLNGQVYAVGGWNGAATQLDLVERLDLATGAWTIGPPLQVARSQHAVIAAADQLWVVGGWSAEEGLVSVIERFSPAQGVWEIVTHLPTPRREPGVSLWQRQLVVAGGFNGSSDADLDGYSDQVEAYDLDQGRWQRLANLGVPRRGLALVSVQDRLFAIGGYTAEEGFTNVVEEYDGVNQRWVMRPWPIVPRTWTATAVSDGAILIAGGYNQEGFLGLVERVDPGTGQICQSPSLKTPRSWFAVVPTSVGMLALGGETATGFIGSIERVETECQK
jgi:Kelch motif